MDSNDSIVNVEPGDEPAPGSRVQEAFSASIMRFMQVSSQPSVQQGIGELRSRLATVTEQWQAVEERNIRLNREVESLTNLLREARHQAAKDSEELQSTMQQLKADHEQAIFAERRRLDERIRALEDEIITKEAKIRDQASEITKFRQRVSSLQRELSDLVTQLSATQTDVRELHRKLGQQSVELTSAEQTLHEQGSQIAALQRGLERSNEKFQMSQKETKFQMSQKEVRDVNNQLAASQASTALAESENYIIQLRAVIGELAKHVAEKVDLKYVPEGWKMMLQDAKRAGKVNEVNRYLDEIGLDYDVRRVTVASHKYATEIANEVQRAMPTFWRFQNNMEASEQRNNGWC
eukprot:TRINITY_DN2287_c0_g2_i1.p1 TRINITY_DN2287_c0_g2~~TRINITY_DN2287_c0_g2_i1.p1  ORF type:complete len:351 (-),score=67.04 TRINITY_DN2287_c0_g2_i1:1226-2278(-)